MIRGHELYKAMLYIDILTALLELGQDTDWLTHVVRAAIIVLYIGLRLRIIPTCI